MNGMAFLLWSTVMLDLSVKLNDLSNATSPWVVYPNGTIQISAIPFHAKIHVVVQVAVSKAWAEFVNSFALHVRNIYLCMHMHLHHANEPNDVKQYVLYMHIWYIPIYIYMYTYSIATCSYPFQSKVLSNQNKGQERNGGTGEGWAANNWCVGSSASALCRVFVQKKQGDNKPWSLWIFAMFFVCLNSKLSRRYKHDMVVCRE